MKNLNRLCDCILRKLSIKCTQSELLHPDFAAKNPLSVVFVMWGGKNGEGLPARFLHTLLIALLRPLTFNGRLDIAVKRISCCNIPQANCFGET